MIECLVCRMEQPEPDNILVAISVVLSYIRDMVVDYFNQRKEQKNTLWLNKGKRSIGCWLPLVMAEKNSGLYDL